MDQEIVENQEVVIRKSNIEKEDERTPDPAELRAATNTDPKMLASAILAKFKEHGYVHIRGIGAAAIGKASMACDIARGKLILMGVNAIRYGYFWEIELNKTDENGQKIVRTGHTTVCEER